MTSSARSFDGLDTDDWLKMLPAVTLRQHLVSPRAQRLLSRLPREVTVADLTETTWAEGGGGRQREETQRQFALAVRRLKRDIRSRDLDSIRPSRSNWIVPDAVGFRLEGRARTLTARSQRVRENLCEIALSPGRNHKQAQALRRVCELIATSKSHPTWLYWYSPQTVALARRANRDTLYELNGLATRTLRALNVDTSISAWEETIDVVSRRLPLCIVEAFEPTRRCKIALGKLESFGVTTLGGLTITSTDSLEFLNRVRLETLASCSSALKDYYLLRVS